MPLYERRKGYDLILAAMGRLRVRCAELFADHLQPAFAQRCGIGESTLPGSLATGGNGKPSPLSCLPIAYLNSSTPSRSSITL